MAIEINYLSLRLIATFFSHQIFCMIHGNRALHESMSACGMACIKTKIHALEFHLSTFHFSNVQCLLGVACKMPSTLSPFPTVPSNWTYEDTLASGGYSVRPPSSYMHIVIYVVANFPLLPICRTLIYIFFLLLG